MTVYQIDGYHLTLDMVDELLRSREARIELSPEARVRCEKSRGQVDRWLEADAPAVYGVNTGLGSLKDVAVPAQEHIRWNRKLPYPHAAGFDEYLPAEITRLALLLRANVLARGYSAVRPALIDRLLSMVNAGISPAVRGHGSTGLSDLGPMSQCVMAVAGLEDACVFYQGKLMAAPSALEQAGLTPGFTLECKEVLAQMNGSTMTQAVALSAFLKLRAILPACLSFCGQPQRVRAIQETVDWIGGILEQENNISCDNPLLFEVADGEFEAVMGCNCSNTQVGYGMDLLSVVIAELGRCLPVQAPNGSILWQRLATLAMQVSGDSIPTKGGQEDHVEFSYTSAEKAAEGIAVLEAMLERCEP